MIPIPRQEVPIIVLARALFSQEATVSTRLLDTVYAIPKRLSLPTLTLLQEDLRKAVIVDWVRRGSDPLCRSQHGNNVRQGPIWNRYDIPKFGGTPFIFHLFYWLLTTSFEQRTWQPPLRLNPQTAFDEYIQLMVCNYFYKQGRLVDLFGLQQNFCNNILLRFIYPDLTYRYAKPKPEEDHLFQSYPIRDNTIILDLLQPLFTKHLIRVEQKKMSMASAKEIITLTQYQTVTLTQYLQTIEKLDRRDLSQCIIHAAVSLVNTITDLKKWSGALTKYQSLNELYQARKQATNFCEHLATIKQWVDHSRSVSFFDHDYQQSQLLLSLWEPLGDAHYQTLQNWSASMCSLSKPSITH